MKIKAWTETAARAVLGCTLVLLFSAQEPVDHGAPEPDPEQPRGLVAREPGALEGYTLFSPLRSTSTYLVDMDGEVVHEWKNDLPPGNSDYLFDDGRILRCGRVENPVFSGGGQGGRIQERSWEGELLWDYAFSDEDKLHHHDIEPLPNGNVLLIAWEAMTAEEALAAGRDPEKVGEKGVWPDYVVEVRPLRPDGGEIVWEWHSRDHLIQDFDAAKANYGDVTRHPERIDFNGDHRASPPMSEQDRRREAEIEEEMRALGYLGGDEDDKEEDEGDKPPPRRGGDWLHTNGIDYHAGYDLIALSVHRFNELWVIDHSTTTAEARGSKGGRWGRGGDLLYRWGNPRTYGRGSEADRRFFRQHDARWIEDDSDELRIQVFNNGEGRPGGNYSSVDELTLPFHPERGFESPGDRRFGPEQFSWSYSAPNKEDFFSSFISGAQPLSNGNNLICCGAPGRIFEVTRAGEIVWDYLNPFGGETPLMAGGGGGNMIPKGLFRATRIPADHPAMKRLEAR